MEKSRTDYLGAVYRLHIYYPKLHELVDAYFSQQIPPSFSPSLNRFYIRLVGNIGLLLDRGYPQLDELIKDFPTLPESFESVGDFADEGIDWTVGFSIGSKNFISKIEKLFSDEGATVTELDKAEKGYIALIDKIIQSLKGSTKVELEFIKKVFDGDDVGGMRLGDYILIDSDDGSAKVVESQNMEKVLVVIADTSLLSYKYFKYLWSHHDKVVRYKELYELDGKKLPTRGERTKVNKSVSKQIGIIKKSILTHLPNVSLMTDKGYILRYQENYPF